MCTVLYCSGAELNKEHLYIKERLYIFVLRIYGSAKNAFFFPSFFELLSLDLQELAVKLLLRSILTVLVEYY